MVMGYYQYFHGAAGERYNSVTTRASTITNTRMADNIEPRTNARGGQTSPTLPMCNLDKAQERVSAGGANTEINVYG